MTRAEAADASPKARLSASNAFLDDDFLIVAIASVNLCLISCASWCTDSGEELMKENDGGPADGRGDREDIVRW